MASKAQIRASIKWNKSQDSITIRPAKAIGEAIRAAAADCGESVTAYILEAVRRRMESEQATPPEWVSVTDRLPEVGSYLVRESDGNIETAITTPSKTRRESSTAISTGKLNRWQM